VLYVSHLPLNAVPVWSRCGLGTVADLGNRPFLDPRPDRRLRHADLTTRLRPRPAGVDQLERPQPLLLHPSLRAALIGDRLARGQDLVGRPDHMGKSKIRVEEALRDQVDRSGRPNPDRVHLAAPALFREQSPLRLRPRLNTTHTPADRRQTPELPGDATTVIGPFARCRNDCPRQ
jgi:hypothetical protein